MTKDCNPVVVTTEFLRVAKIGLANSAKAIQALLSQSITMSVVWAGSMPVSQFGEVTGDPEGLVIGAYVRVTGDIPGHALLVFSKADALRLSDLALGLPAGASTELGEMEESVVQEVANVLTSSYLTAIADHYNLPLLPDPPLMAVDMAGAIVESVLIGAGQVDSETLSIVTRFRVMDQILNGFFLYIPENMLSMERQAA